MAENNREVLRHAARRVGLDSIAQELERRVTCEGCPAAEFIRTVRGDVLPGVRCRVEHNTMSVGTDPRTILRWCAQPGNTLGNDGYPGCPTWQYEKDRLALGLHSLGDEDRLDELSDATWREDVTGSASGDLALHDQAVAAAEDTIAMWQEEHAARQGDS